MRLKSKVICDDGYGRLNGRDGSADETPTQSKYTNNFDSHLASRIRSAQQGFHNFPEEYIDKFMKVYSIDNTCDGVHTTSGNVPKGAIVHWAGGWRGEVPVAQEIKFDQDSIKISEK